MLIRYWFEFQYNHCRELPGGLGLGCGITAYNYEDALFLLSKEVFKNTPLAPIKKVIENVDISTLEAGHVLPNMVPPNLRGIWYPFGYNVFK
ncbi:hypothetical protein FHW89_004657 [Mucilaginibacter sp. SG564]|nr:hypothetical protein [Mucilaginibacter sp. SG564]